MDILVCLDPPMLYASTNEPNVGKVEKSGFLYWRIARADEI